MTVYAWNRETKQAWRVRLSPPRLRRYDNGHLVSIGLTVGVAGTDTDVRPSLLTAWEQDGIATPVSYDEAMHSGCQSSCIRRGGATCRW